MTTDSRIQNTLLAIFLSLLWWICGLLSGSIAAFYMYSERLDGSARDWPPIIVFAAFTLGCGVYGSWRTWQIYSREAADGSRDTPPD